MYQIIGTAYVNITIVNTGCGKHFRSIERTINPSMAREIAPTEAHWIDRCPGENLTETLVSARRR